MAKFSLPPNKLVRSSIRLPVKMLVDIDRAMQDSCFNRKQRSKWISSATEQLLLRTDAPNLIAEEFISPGSCGSIPITFEFELSQKIDNVIKRVWDEESHIADRSSVIRTAITQKLMALIGIQLSPKETLIERIAEIGKELNEK